MPHNSEWNFLSLANEILPTSVGPEQIMKLSDYVTQQIEASYERGSRETLEDLQAEIAERKAHFEFGGIDPFNPAATTQQKMYVQFLALLHSKLKALNPPKHEDSLE